MAGLARPVARPFRHEGRHPAAALREDLGERLEQRRLVGRASASSTVIAASSTPGPVSVCRPSSSMSIARAGVEQLVIEFRVHRRAQHRIAEEARRDVLEVAIALLAHGMRRLVEEEELELGGGRDGVAHVRRRASARGAASPRGQTASRVAGELAEEERQIVFERDAAACVSGSDAHRRVRIGGVPAGERRRCRRAGRSNPSRARRRRSRSPSRAADELVAAPCICRA